MTFARRPWLILGPVALVAGAIAFALTLTSDHEEHPAEATALLLFVSGSFVLSGLIGWSLRPQNRTGKLMVLVGFGVLATSLAESNYALPYTIGLIVGSVFIASYIHLLLAYPSGELISKFARWLVVSGYTTALVASLIAAMFPGEQTCKPHACPDNLALVSRDHGAYVAQTAVVTVIVVLLFVDAFVLLVGRWRRATPALRRILRPVYLAGGLSLMLLAVGFVVTPFTGLGDTIVMAALIATFTAVPWLFLAGLLGTKIARGAGIGRIFSSIPERASPGEVQEGLRSALRDETAQVAYWYDEGGHYVDIEGNHFDLPPNTRKRVVTRLEYADAPVAAIVHDAALLQEPELLETITGAARVALERDKLLVEVRARAERYRALLQALPDLMFRITRNGRYLGYSAPSDRDLVARDVVGLSLRDRLPADLAERVLAAGREALDTGEPVVIEYSLDFESEPRR